MLKKRSVCLALAVFLGTVAVSVAQGHAPVPPSPDPSPASTTPVLTPKTVQRHCTQLDTARRLIEPPGRRSLHNTIPGSIPTTLYRGIMKLV